jgi:intraflagellar transport protein 88
MLLKLMQRFSKQFITWVSGRHPGRCNRFQLTFIAGLINKKIGEFDEALNYFHKLNANLGHQQHPEIIFQIGNVYELMGDYSAALEWYHQLLGIVQTDAGILKKVGELYEMKNERQQAFHYHLESYRLYPSDFSVVNWIGSHFIELQIAEKAISFFEKAVLNNPNDSYFLLRVAGSYRKINAQKSMQLFQQIHEKFPENVDCLRALIHLTHSQGLNEQHDKYVDKLEKLEKHKEVRNRINSARPGTSSYNSARLSGSGKSNASGNVEHHAITSNFNMANNNYTLSSNVNSPVDYSYSDPLEADNYQKRPFTSGRRIVESYSDEEIDDELLPI